MKFSTMLISRDLEQTKAFYAKLFKMRVISDFVENITLTGGLSFQTIDSWSTFIHKDAKEIKLGGNDVEIYAEIDDLDAFVKLVEQEQVKLVHPLQTHSWGQRGLRIYDPDMHIIEIAEPLSTVVKRFFKEGLCVEQISEKTLLSVKIVQRMLK